MKKNEKGKDVKGIEIFSRSIIDRKMQPSIDFDGLPYIAQVINRVFLFKHVLSDRF